MPSDAERTPRFSATRPGDWLIPYKEGFLAELEGQGYAPGTIHHFRHAIDQFREQVAVRELGPEDIDTPGLAEIQDSTSVPTFSSELAITV